MIRADQKAKNVGHDQADETDHAGHRDGRESRTRLAFGYRLMRSNSSIR